MFEKVLPIGSIVLLKDASKKVMIIGYCKYKRGDNETVYDYAGCLYPEGFMGPDMTVVFNHDQIHRIYALGFQNEERFEFEVKLKAAIAKIKN